MKIFLDTGRLEEVQQYKPFIDGVTTNPSLVSSFDVAKVICNVITGPVSVEVTELLWQKMVEQARYIRKMGENVVIKLPLTVEGLIACRELFNEGTKINVTLVFSANQGLLAMKAGATYVSPFIGRLDDIGMDGMQLVRDLVQIKKNYGFKTQILAASIRTPEQVKQCALAGADVVTVPAKILEQMFNHPKTDEGLKKFMEDWKNAQKN